MLNRFNYQGNELEVNFIEKMDVKEGVVCDVYEFVNDKEKDLGIVAVSAGHSTPLQKILKGDTTIEGFVSGKARLIINPGQKNEMVYDVEDGQELEVEVKIGQTMQWIAETDLVFYEVCTPPYEDGRFENLN